MLEPDECARIIGAAHGCTGWREATVTYGEASRVLSAVRCASILDEADWPPELAPLAATIRTRTEALGAARARELRAGPLQLVRYERGGFFMLHCDASDDPQEWRKLSAVLYLNDGFGGGETRFPGRSEDVRARAGHALLFAPSLAHEGAPVTKGEKYIISFWLGR